MTVCVDDLTNVVSFKKFPLIAVTSLLTAMFHQRDLVFTTVANNQLNRLEQFSFRICAIVNLAHVKARLPLFFQDVAIVDPDTVLDPMDILYNCQLFVFKKNTLVFFSFVNVLQVSPRGHSDLTCCQSHHSKRLSSNHF